MFSAKWCSMSDIEWTTSIFRVVLLSVRASDGILSFYRKDDDLHMISITWVFLTDPRELTAQFRGKLR